MAALYVEKDGAYFGLPGVDPWDEERDAMRYAGPWPVVAHPPCNHWCQLASVNAARYETFHIGDDGGRFAAALDAVNEYGGVLEHPAHSLAWPHFDLAKPQRGSWQRGLWQPGWVTEISQSAYGCPARKRTWLYYIGDEPAPLDWRDPRGEAVIGGGINSGECVGRRKIEKREASATPTALRDVLLNLARSARMEAVACPSAAQGHEFCIVDSTRPDPRTCPDCGQLIARRWHRMDGYYRDDDGNEILGSRGEWMLLAGESVCGPFWTLAEAKRYVEENDV